MKINKKHFVVGIIIVAILSRLIPHPPNFTPVTAVALFSIINFKNKYIGLSIPIVCLLISDLIIGISLINLFVYLSFIVISGVGYIFGKINLKSILLISVISFILLSYIVSFILSKIHIIFFISDKLVKSSFLEYCIFIVLTKFMLL
jgi:hypothetical protein